MLIFRLTVLYWVSSKKIFTNFNTQKTKTISHSVHCCSTSIHPQSDLSVLGPVSLRPPSQKSSVL